METCAFNLKLYVIKYGVHREYKFFTFTIFTVLLQQLFKYVFIKLNDTFTTICNLMRQLFCRVHLMCKTVLKLKRSIGLKAELNYYLLIY